MPHCRVERQERETTTATLRGPLRDGNPSPRPLIRSLHAQRRVDVRFCSFAARSCAWDYDLTTNGVAFFGDERPLGPDDIALSYQLVKK